ncbi:protein mono-ADP-ribosyltransferase PARP9-like isoform X2 [Haliotis asinina]|uniref:protein mono-ADP-ribosyltransferase PARP9-like isoform X2 n=1 Tax=Haliotis asinina TaxID=109174 RepID=UPI0035318555
MTTEISQSNMGIPFDTKINNTPMDINCKDNHDNGQDKDSGIQTPSSADSLRQEPTYPAVNDISSGNKFKHHVILCSGSGTREAEAIQSNLNVDTGKVPISVCNDRTGVFNNIPPSDTALYIVVDSPMCDILMKGRRLPDSVYDFFEEFPKSSKVYLKNALPPQEHWRYDGLRCQLPQDCVREYKEVFISCRQTPDRDEGHRPGESESGAESMESVASIDDDVVDEDEDEDDNDEEGSDVFPTEHIQIGSNCTMNITPHPSGELMMRQDGTQNTMNVQIVPGETMSKVLVVINAEPLDPDFDRLLLREMTGQMGVININLQSQNAQVVRFSPGSVIVEIDLKPGQTVGPEWIKTLLGNLFNKTVKSCIPTGTNLRVDIKSKVCLPVQNLEPYLTEMSSNIHEGCVARQKYEELAKELEELRKSDTSGQRLSVHVISGDITTEKTDAIVNSTNTKLKLSEGKLSKSILKAGGPSIQKECSTQYPAGLETGVVGKTGGGSLACENIYHVVLPNIWNNYGKVVYECFRSIITKILQQADSDGQRVISIPPIGTGERHYKPDIVADIMFDVCRRFRSKSLTHVRLVVMPEFAEVHKAFMAVSKTYEHEHSHTEKAPMTSELSASSSKAFIPDGKQTEVKGVIEVIPHTGDITALEVDAVVSSTNPYLNLRNGVLSMAILKKAKGVIEEELRANYPDGITEGQVAFTSGGQSQWKQLYFTVLRQWEDSEELKNSFFQVIMKCLQLASESQLVSIAFPLLGTKRHDYPPDLVTEWLTEAVRRYGESNPETSVFKAFIVVRPEDQISAPHN